MPAGVLELGGELCGGLGFRRRRGHCGGLSRRFRLIGASALRFHHGDFGKLPLLDEVLLELPRQELPPAARQLPLRLIEAADRIEITTDDLDGTLRTLMDAHVPLKDLRIRPPNLEDLFLELTGKELRA